MPDIKKGRISGATLISSLAKKKLYLWLKSVMKKITFDWNLEGFVEQLLDERLVRGEGSRARGPGRA